MHAIKDTVSEKLSRLFSDSPSPRSLDQDPPEARPYTKDGRSLSSLLSFILPPANLDWFRPSTNDDEVKSIKSNSFQWRSKSFSLKDKPLDRLSSCDPDGDKFEDTSQNHKPSSTHVEDREPGSGRSTGSSSDVFEDAFTPHSFERSKPMPNLMDDSIFITPNLYQFFESSLPNIVKGCQWVLLYSTLRHGISFRTLLRNSAGLSGPCLLITGDKQGAVFGGLLDCPLQPTAKRKYQGTIRTFVFTTIYGEPRLFRPTEGQRPRFTTIPLFLKYNRLSTRANRYFYLLLNDMLALGGGANFALCLNEDLLSGTSGPCETFGNMCLAHEEEFELKNVELWGFTHASQYLY